MTRSTFAPYKPTVLQASFEIGLMWSRLEHIAFGGHIQHRRISGAATEILMVRLLEGLACWIILYSFFREVTAPAWAIDLNFIAYGFANVVLFIAHRSHALTPGLVWFDIVANLLPMAAAAHWTGGVYSPLLPVFVMKIVSYGLLYGADIGLQSLVAMGMIAVGVAIIEHAGVNPAEIQGVSLWVRFRLSLAFSALLCVVGCGGSLRTFRILQDREQSLAEAVQEKDRLYQESLRHQRHLRQLSRRMMDMSEQTMRQLARELHDDLGQALTAVKIELGFVERELPADSSARGHVRGARDQISALLQNIRSLSQLLRPAVLDDLGLIAAMQSYVTSFSERTRIPTELKAPPPETRLPRPLEVAVYRVLQEALTNVARHAHAGHVRVHLHVADGRVTLQVTDDGCGFDTAVLQNPAPDHSMGVIGMRERVATYGGHFVIESRPGAGTHVELAISLTEPIEAAEENHAEDSRLVG